MNHTYHHKHIHQCILYKLIHCDRLVQIEGNPEDNPRKCCCWPYYRTDEQDSSNHKY